MKLLLLNLRTTFFRLIEQSRVVLLYYRNLSFFLSDALLAGHYLFANPHRISRRFMQQRGESNIYTYGETPLTTLDKIARKAHLLSHDTVYEVGCGSGRTIFWLNHFVKCRAIGIDYQRTFIQRASRVAKWRRLPNAHFHLQDMLERDYSDASAIYLYGTCLSDDTLEKLLKRFERLKPGTKVITVSYPLDGYKLLTSFTGRFPWGKAEIFVNCKVDAPRRDKSGETARETAPSASSSL